MCDVNVEPAVIRVLYAYIKCFLVDHRMPASTVRHDIVQSKECYCHPLVYIDNTLLIILNLCTVNSACIQREFPEVYLLLISSRV
jgi:hypothetical protein